MHVHDLISMIVEAAAIVALIFALVQFREAKQHKRDLIRQMGKLEQQTLGLWRIQQSLSTRYLGLFPRYVSDIADLVRQARQEILILCDYPAYACFSDAKACRAYQRAIEDKISDGVKVHLICYTDDERAKFHEKQFPQRGESWVTWRAHPDNHPRLEAMHRDYRNAAGLTAATVEDLDEAGFKSLMLAANRRMRDETFVKGTRMMEIDTYMPIYFWLVDSTEAVFSIPSLTAKASEHGFRTISSDFITAFKDMWERYAEDAQSNGSRTPRAAPAAVPAPPADVPTGTGGQSTAA